MRYIVPIRYGQMSNNAVLSNMKREIAIVVAAIILVAILVAGIRFIIVSHRQDDVRCEQWLADVTRAVQKARSEAEILQDLGRPDMVVSAERLERDFSMRPAPGTVKALVFARFFGLGNLYCAYIFVGSGGRVLGYRITST